MEKLRRTRSRSMQTTSQFSGRLPKQIQRALPVYAILVLFILIISNVDTLKSSTVSHAKRSTQKILKGSTTADFPRKIWQTWKVDPLGFAERDLLSARTWTQLNPGHRYEVLTDNNDMYYVETHFGPDELDRPDIVEMYRSLKVQIIKADLLRYLIMYVEGGVYTDIDVEALKAVNAWIPDRYSVGDVDMVVSVEIDQPEFKDHPILGQKSQSFCQWTFMCKPRLPVMLALNVPISEIKLDFDEVISGTGPSAFTGAILKEMTIKTGDQVDWSTFHAMRESKLVGGFLVLTVEAFAAGQGHSDSGNHNARGALVKHHYHASEWPLLHPRFSHPIYGELSPEEKEQQIAIKKALDEHDALHAKMGAQKLDLNALNMPQQNLNPIPQAAIPMPQPGFHPDGSPVRNLDGSIMRNLDGSLPINPNAPPPAQKLEIKDLPAPKADPAPPNQPQIQPAPEVKAKDMKTEEKNIPKDSQTEPKGEIFLGAV
ncbi:glycosyl transferase [Botrytis cinerea]